MGSISGYATQLVFLSDGQGVEGDGSNLPHFAGTKGSLGGGFKLFESYVNSSPSSVAPPPCFFVS